MGEGGTGWEGMGWEGGWLLGSGFVFGVCGNLTSENCLSTGDWMGRGMMGREVLFVILVAFCLL